MTQKLMDYLPNALSIIFVVNAGSAGGMQGDRVIEQCMFCNTVIDPLIRCFSLYNNTLLTFRKNKIFLASSYSQIFDITAN